MAGWSCGLFGHNKIYDLYLTLYRSRSLFKYTLFLVFSLLYSAEVLSETATHTLFAVDVSLSANEKETAFEIIRETAYIAPETHSIGLTLFDDTVRGFVDPAPLDNQQIKILHQTMTDAPVSVRSTSNLAVGIERAIDAFEQSREVNLVVFSRGVIDTKSKDPRARFIEWLDQVLLPQATLSNIAVSLVVNQNQSNLGPGLESNSKEIRDVFARNDTHKYISWASGTRIAPELISLLNIPDRNYAKVNQSDASVTESTTITNTVDTDKTTTILEDTISPTTNPVDANTANNALDVEEPFTNSVLPIIRLALLAFCLALLLGIILWRYSSKRASGSADHTGHLSSGYLPLTRKPSETMGEYREKDTDLTSNSKPQDRQ